MTREAEVAEMIVGDTLNGRQARLEIVPFAFGVYRDSALAVIDAESEVENLGVVMAEFGATVVPWHVDPIDRGLDAIAGRLSEWSSSADAAATLLYWIGHGWSDGHRAVLLHARSASTLTMDGLIPEILADAILRRDAIAATENDDTFTIVVVETVNSAPFLQLVAARLLASPSGAPRCLLVGSSVPGSFTSALSEALSHTFRSVKRVRLWGLAAELEQKLTGGYVWISKGANVELARGSVQHVFISYVREDSADADKLAGQLRDAGVQVWLDRIDLNVGDRWKDSIRAAIRHGDYFIACFSPAYASRERTYMNEELAVAVEELRLRPRERSWFLPITLGPAKVPAYPIGPGETLQDLHHIDLSSNWADGLARLMRVIVAN